MNVTVVVPYDEAWHGKQALENTIKSCINAKVEYLVVSRTKLNVKHFVFNFKSVWQAFNKATNRVNTEYIAYILPGEFVSPQTYNIEYNEDLIQLQHIRVNNGNTYMKYNNLADTYRLDSIIPQHINLICDKVFKTEIIKNYQIRFCNNDKFSPLIFILEYMSHILKMRVVANEIIHTIKNTIFSNDEEYKMLDELFRKLPAIQTDNWVLKERIEKELKNNRYIDYVFPYVTMNDPQWRADYQKYKVGVTDSWWSTSEERFRDNGTLPYTIKSIQKNLPWIRKIHMLVAYESQVPEWINRNEIDIITHDEFIPKQHLPTFNSSTIEMFYWNLPERVSNIFLYGNDDMLWFSKQSQSKYIHNGHPKYLMNFRDYRSDFPADVLRRQAYNLIFRCCKNRAAVNQHCPIVYRKDWLKDFYLEYKQIIDNSCTRFREDKNFNQYVYCLYQVIEKTVEQTTEQNMKSLALSNKNISNVIKMDFSQWDSICFNDQDITEKNYQKAVEHIKEYFYE